MLIKQVHLAHIFGTGFDCNNTSIWGGYSFNNTAHFNVRQEVENEERNQVSSEQTQQSGSI